MGKGKNVAKTLLSGFLFVVAIFAFAGSFFMLKEVISTRWPLLVITFVLAVFTSLPLKGFWRWITDSDNKALTILCNILLIWPLLVVLSLIINNSSDKKCELQRAVVERKYTETHYKTRRVSRRTYTRGAPYKVYFIDLKLNNGKTRSVELNYEKYNRVAKDDSIGISVKKGRLGLVSFDSRHLEIPKKKKKARSYGRDFRKDRYLLHKRHKDHS